MRIGLMFGGSDGSLDAAITQARRAERAGFASFWLANIFGLDAITTARDRRPRDRTRIELGTAVVPTYPRHPTAMAQQALTAQAACERPLRARHRPLAPDRDRGHVRPRRSRSRPATCASTWRCWGRSCAASR